MTTNDMLREIQARIEADDERLSRGMRDIASFLLTVIDGTASVDDMKRQRTIMHGFLNDTAAITSQQPTPQLLVERGAVMRALEVIERHLGMEGQRFMYFPGIKEEVFAEPEQPGEPQIRGTLKCGYGTSAFEFHWEYPINGFGVRKDRIYVVQTDGPPISIFDYCRKHNISVYCNRCGADITFEVSMNCAIRFL